MAYHSVDEYLASLPQWQREMASVLRRLVHNAAPECTETIKWAQPVFEDHGPVCYIKPYSRHLNFGFWRGSQLPDPKRVLTGTGGRMRHVKLHRGDDPDESTLRSLVVEAVRLNREHGNPTRAG